MKRNDLICFSSAECSAGTFSDSGYNFDGLCRDCPANFYQDRTGSTRCSQCLNTQYTSPGQIGLTSSTACLTTGMFLILSLLELNAPGELIVL